MTKQQLNDRSLVIQLERRWDDATGAFEALAKSKKKKADRLSEQRKAITSLALSIGLRLREKDPEGGKGAAWDETAKLQAKLDKAESVLESMTKQLAGEVAEREAALRRIMHGDGMQLALFVPNISRITDLKVGGSLLAPGHVVIADGESYTVEGFRVVKPDGSDKEKEVVVATGPSGEVELDPDFVKLKRPKGYEPLERRREDRDDLEDDYYLGLERWDRVAFNTNAKPLRVVSGGVANLDPEPWLKLEGATFGTVIGFVAGTSRVLVWWDQDEGDVSIDAAKAVDPIVLVRLRPVSQKDRDGVELRQGDHVEVFASDGQPRFTGIVWQQVSTTNVWVRDDLVDGPKALQRVELACVRKCEPPAKKGKAKKATKAKGKSVEAEVQRGMEAEAAESVANEPPPAKGKAGKKTSKKAPLRLTHPPEKGSAKAGRRFNPKVGDEVTDLDGHREGTVIKIVSDEVIKGRRFAVQVEVQYKGEKTKAQVPASSLMKKPKGKK